MSIAELYNSFMSVNEDFASGPESGRQKDADEEEVTDRGKVKDVGKKMPKLQSKADVNYREAEGEEEDDARCENCKFFIKEKGACEKVEGDISPDYVCDLYEPK